MADGITGWRRIVRATKVSYVGMGWAVREEEAFRIELILFWSLLLVLIVELLNTAVEVVVDRIGLERHVLSGRAKDLGSAAVHLSLLQVPIVWGLILLS